MQKTEKIRRTREWLKDIGVWLDPSEDTSLLSYVTLKLDEKPVLRLTRHIFSLSYGLTDAKTGKRIELLATCPFTSVALAHLSASGSFVTTGRELRFKDDEVPSHRMLYWDNVEIRKADSEKFWRALLERTEELKEEAKRMVWSSLKKLRLRRAYRATRLYLGTRKWLKEADWIRELPKLYRPGDGWTTQWPLVRATDEEDAREIIEQKFNENTRIAYHSRRDYHYWLDDGRPVSRVER